MNTIQPVINAMERSLNSAYAVLSGHAFYKTFTSSKETEIHIKQYSMKKLTLLLIAFTITVSGMSQNLGKFSYKDEGFTQKKFNHGEKKIFIQHFNVHYQTVMISYAKAKGGSNYGSAEAGLALGLDNVNAEQLQAMTDQYYADFTKKLTDQGFTILTVDEVQENEHFAAWDRLEGGTPAQDAAAPGYLSTSPNGFTALDGGAGLFNLGGHPESKQLGGVTVVRVSLVIPFAESQSINGGLVGGVAKITARADLRISPSESIPAKGDFSKPKQLLTNVSFGYKESLKWQALSMAKLSKPLEIEGVLDEDKKYKSTSVSTTGSGFSARYSEAYAANAILIPCDAAEYQKGVDAAVAMYLNAALDDFLGVWK